jgi:hypothetical protein
LEPIWEQLATELQGSKVTIARVDATVAEELSSSVFKIQGYPTLLLIQDGKIYEYAGNRVVIDLKRFAVGEIERPAPTLLPQKVSEFDRYVQKAQHQWHDLEGDLQHIFAIRKLAFAVTVVASALFGFVIGRCSNRTPKAAAAKTSSVGESKAPSVLKIAAAVGSYCACSIAVVLLNKWVLSYEALGGTFKFPLFMVRMHMLLRQAVAPLRSDRCDGGGVADMVPDGACWDPFEDHLCGQGVQLHPR